MQVTAHARAPAFFAPVTFGVDGFDTRVTTVVEGGTIGRVGCYLPLAVSSCLLTSGAGLCNRDLAFDPAAVQNVVWARVDPVSAPSPGWISSQLSTCADDEARVGDPLQLHGEPVPAAFDSLATAVAGGTHVWDPASWGPLPPRMADSAIPEADYGHIVSGPIAVFASASCTGRAWAPSTTTRGFAWAVVYDVRTGPSPTLAARVLCDEQYGPLPGGIAGTGYAASPWFRR